MNETSRSSPARPSTRSGVFLLAALCPLASCGGDGSPATDSPAATGPAWFEDASAASGVDFVHEYASEVRYWLPEIMGSGTALFDYDGDGDLDLYCVQSGDLLTSAGERPGNRLFRNDGSGRFDDVTGTAGVGDRGYGRGCVVGDYDGDGDVDLYVTNLGPNVLYRNEGDGTFTDVTDASGVGDGGWGTSAAFLDHDADGDLDLFIVNYISWSVDSIVPCRAGNGDPEYCTPLNYAAPATDVLYRNEGDGTFTDQTQASGVGTAFGNGLGVATDDFDGDGRVDIYVANDAMPNQLWMNQGDGTFVDRALVTGCAVNMFGAPEAGMGVAAADIENDGDPDLLMTHLRGETNTLYINDGGRFRDLTSSSGLSRPSMMFTGFGMGFADFDQDGLLDLYVANGRVGRFRPDFDERDPYAEPNQLFRGRGEGKFEEILPRGGTDELLIGTSRGLSFGDIDGDGDVDVIVSENGAGTRILRNVASEGGWVSFRAVTADADRTRDMHGARVRIRAGDRTVWRTVGAAFSYCSANDLSVHFGLGDAARVDAVTVFWPGGAEEDFGPFDAGARHVLRRGAGE